MLTTTFSYADKVLQNRELFMPRPDIRPDNPDHALLPAILTAAQLSSGYGRYRVLQGLDLAIARDRFTVLLGPNGCGKSTLLANFARLLPPQSGSVLLDGRDIARQNTVDVAKKLGLLPQQPPVPDGLSVFELVARGRYPHQGLFRQWSRQDERAVEEAMVMADIGEWRHQPVDQLSGGQRQRVWLAMVLAQETPVLLLDEPTSFLDMAHQIAILALLRQLVRDHKRTIICVLHDLNMALQYGDDFIFMKQGHIAHILHDARACTPEIVADVFEVQSLCVPHPQSGLPVFLPAFLPASGDAP